jgi:hypothetical protein
MAKKRGLASYWLHILLLGAGLVYLIIPLDNIAQPSQNLLAFMACFQTNNL